MEKKNKRYILLGAVILIWGLIGYQIFEHLYPSETENAINTVEDFKPVTNKEPKENYSINEYSRDPFLGTTYKKKRKVIKKTVKPSSVNFPSIAYNGMVKGNRQTTYIVSINNTQEILRIGQVFNGVKLINGNAKEIRVLYKGMYKTIMLQ